MEPNQLLDIPTDELPVLFHRHKKEMLQENFFNQLLEMDERIRNVVIEVAVDHLLEQESEAALKMTIHTSPSWFYHPVAHNKLSALATTPSDQGYLSLHILDLLGQYHYRMDAHPYRQPELYQIIHLHDHTPDTEERIKLLNQALSIAGQELPSTIFNLQLLLANNFTVRTSGKSSENIEKAFHIYESFRNIITSHQYPYLYASIQSGLGRCAFRYQKGNIGNNIEQAIEYFTEGLRTIHRMQHPYLWGELQLNLGIAYMDRLKGEKNKNRELALYHLKQAAQVFSRKWSAQQWVLTVTAIGNFFNYKNAADPQQSIQDAIDYFSAAMSYHTRTEFPMEWACLHISIGEAYFNKASCDTNINLEKAIGHVNEAIDVITPDEHPSDWIRAHQVLGKLFQYRITGEQMTNQETSVQLFKKIFIKCNAENNPYDIAITHLMLANLYQNRLRGHTNENISLAILHLQEALTLFTFDLHPVDWASAQQVLGNIHHHRLQKENGQHIEEAIEYYRQALKVRSTEHNISEWSYTMIQLGDCLVRRSKGNRINNLQQALAVYQAVASHIHPGNHPTLLAHLQYGFGKLYAGWPEGNSKYNHQFAIQYFRQSLEWFDSDPVMTFTINHQLGDSCMAIQDFQSAKSAFISCHHAAEIIRQQSLREFTFQQIAAECSELYPKLVAVCIHLNDIQEAYQYVIAAKARVFTDKLANADNSQLKELLLRPGFNSAWQNICQIRDEISQLTSIRSFYYIQSEEGLKNPESPQAQVAERRAKLSKKLEELFFNYPEASGMGNEPLPSLENIFKLVQEKRFSIADYYYHANGWCVFVICNDQLHYSPLNTVTHDWVKGVHNFLAEYETGVICGQSAARFSERADTCFAEVYNKLIASWIHLLPAGINLVIAPSRELHLIPFHLGYIRDENRYMMDFYSINYLSGARACYTLHQQLKNELATTQKESVLTVVYSAREVGMPLHNALQEATEVKKHFLPNPQSVYLEEKAAVPQAVIEYCNKQKFNVIHFACHAWFKNQDPENSGLLLYKGMLTVEHIRTALRLKGLPQVILSACQTGQFKINEADEAMGLVQSFFQAGAGCVIASLWSIDDHSTMEFFKQYYIQCKTLSREKAFTSAMLEIRKIDKWRHPVYWGAFKQMGLPD